MVHLVVSNSGPHQLPDIGRSFGRSDASRIDTSIRGDVFDLTARDTNVYKLAVRQARLPEIVRDGRFLKSKVTGKSCSIGLSP